MKYKYNFADIQVKCLYPKPTLMAVQLFLKIFAREKEMGLFATGEYNLYGRCSKGREFELKRPLDSGKVRILRDFVEDHMPHGSKKEDVWADCCDVIHKKISKFDLNLIEISSFLGRFKKSCF
jgi:hypothetical protein